MRRGLPRQLELRPTTWGGRREGAGRKPLPEGKRRVSHLARERFEKATPVHVTLRVGRHVWNLRSARSFRRIVRAFAAHKGRHPLRLIEFTVQGNHLHLVVEADSNEALSRGMQGLAIRIARALNAMMKRTGHVFADHYHSRLLRTPTELVRAIAYVLGNAAHHFGRRGADPFASSGIALEIRARALDAPQTWLVLIGWRRAKPAPEQPHGTFGAPMTGLSLWRTISVGALAALWIADLIVLILESRRRRRRPQYWWSLAGIFFLGLLTVSDLRLAQLERAAEQEQLRLNQQAAWRGLTAEQHEKLVATLKGHPLELWLAWVGSDPEATAFRFDLDLTLREAGVVTKIFSGWQMAVGLQITQVPGPDYDLLVAAFEKAGLPLTPVVPNPRFAPQQLQIIVGSKPPP